MMTPEQIAAMRADADAGTPGPWVRGGMLPREFVARGTAYPIRAPEWSPNTRVCHVSGWDDDAPDEALANARRIARVPLMEATIIAQAAEIERLKEMLTVQWEGIPWRDGPPPAEWRDGRDVLVWSQFPVIASARVKGSWWHPEGVFDDSEITHHAAVTLPKT